MTRRSSGMFPRVVVVVVIVIRIVGGWLAAVIESVIGGRGGRRRRQRAPGWWRFLHGALDFLFDAAGRLLELANRAAQAAREIGQALSAEEQQHEDENQEQLGTTDVSDEREDGRNHGRRRHARGVRHCAGLIRQASLWATWTAVMNVQATSTATLNVRVCRGGTQCRPMPCSAALGGPIQGSTQ